MSISLVKGQKIDLTKGNAGLRKVVFALGWDLNRYDGDAEFDLDVSAFFTDDSGKVTGEQDFVFYGQPQHPSGSLTYSGDNRTGDGDGDDETMWSEMHNVVKDYAKVGKRNQHAIEHNKLGKHMMHLIRLYMMCLDILENKEIVTFRSKEHDLLMSIRNGKYLDANRQPIPEFFEMVDEYEKKMQYAKENTDLPEKPDYKKIQEFVIDVNERVVRGLI